MFKHERPDEGVVQGETQVGVQTHTPALNNNVLLGFSDMSSQVKVWRGKRVLVGEEVMAATVVVQGNTIKNVLPGVVDVPG